MHGYSIIREVALRSGGTWRLSPGAVYPTLGVLEAEGLVTSSETAGKSVYALTESGREARVALGEVTPPWETSAEQDPRALREAIGTLAAAAMQVAKVGTVEQRDQAAAILVDARRKLYQLLADDPDA
jgi:DNA-binding PadR family transcriptional regulator